MAEGKDDRQIDRLRGFFLFGFNKRLSHPLRERERERDGLK
jgi:hypothetical protein